MYDHLCIVSFKGLNEEETMETLLENDADFIDIEIDEGETVVYGHPNDLFNIKEAISKKLPNIEFDMDEITYIAKDKVVLTGEDKETFDKLLTMLDDIEDVQHIYHNVEM